MKVRPICDWGLHNLALLPTVVIGKGSQTGAGWFYIWFLKGRLGASRW